MKRKLEVGMRSITSMKSNPDIDVHFYEYSDRPLHTWFNSHPPRKGDQVVLSLNGGRGIYEVNNVRWMSQNTVKVFVGYLTSTGV